MRARQGGVDWNCWSQRRLEMDINSASALRWWAQPSKLNFCLQTPSGPSFARGGRNGTRCSVPGAAEAIATLLDLNQSWEEPDIRWRDVHLEHPGPLARALKRVAGVRSENRGSVWLNARRPSSQGLDGRSGTGCFGDSGWNWTTDGIFDNMLTLGLNFSRSDHGILQSVKCPDSEET